MDKEILLHDVLSESNDELAHLILEFSKLSLILHKEFPHRLGEAGTKNVYGEEQKALDVWTNEFLINELFATGLVKSIASEELPDVVESEDGTGSFSLTLDPLDGSSNVKSNNLFGTILGIYRDTKLPARGREMVAAVYKLYGPITSMVVSYDKKVLEFVRSRKGHTDFILINENVRLPGPKIYGVGGNPDKWIPEFELFVKLLRNKGLKLRYGGSMVGDFNQVMHSGGFFGYPSMMDKPSGKLRLQFECNPMSFIIENAGGDSSNGHESILDIKPKSIDQRTPVYLGNQELIDSLEDIYRMAKRAREEF